jgi:DHA2 family methylenomycin A resistance protein-like MFS transporter
MLPLQLGLCLAAAGTGLAVPAVTTAVLASVERERGGVAAGVLNSIRQSGGAIGVALFGALGDGGGAQLVAGAATAFTSAAALCAIAVAVAAIGVRPARAARTDGARQAEGPCR